MSFLRKLLRIPFPILILDKFLSVVKVSAKCKYWIYGFIVWSSTYFYYCNVNYSYIPLGSVKGTLNPSSCLSSNTTYNRSEYPTNCTGWEPFIGYNGNTLLGLLDFISLVAYAFGMLIIGNIADYLDYRYVIIVGGFITFTSSTLFGTGYYLAIHSFVYYLFSQFLLGVGAGASPGCIAILGKWFHGKRSGIILGLWSTSIPLSKIAGKLIAGVWADDTWGASFYSSSVLAFTSTVLLIFFLVPEPEYFESLHLEKDEDVPTKETAVKNVPTKKTNVKNAEGIRIWKAILIPGVIEYALVLSFSNLAYYSMFFWLPYLFGSSKIGGVLYSTSASSFFTIAFDFGNIIGSFVGGGLSDLLGSHAIVVTIYLYSTVLLLYIYYVIHTIHLGYNLLLLVLLGITVGGAYVTIFTSVTVDLGSKDGLKNNTRAIATVNGMIAFAGGIAGSFAGLIVGVLINYGIAPVLYFLMSTTFVAGVILTRITLRDIVKLYKWHFGRNVYYAKQVDDEI